MLKLKNILFPFFILFFFVQTTEAQKGWEGGAWVGISHYFGDLNTNFDLSKPGLAGGLNARYNFNSRLSFMSSFSVARIRESDFDSPNPFEKSRNIHFRSDIYDFSTRFEFNFMPYIHGTSDYFTPYFLLGMSVFNYNPQAEHNDKWYNLREYGTEGQIAGEEYYSYSAGLIYGVGIKWDINYRVSMNVEINSRLLGTDYLDDVSTVYPNKSEINSLYGEIGLNLSNPSTVEGFGAQGTQRGNSRDTDTYVMTAISFMYYFGYLTCPSITTP